MKAHINHCDQHSDRLLKAVLSCCHEAAKTFMETAANAKVPTIHVLDCAAVMGNVQQRTCEVDMR